MSIKTVARAFVTRNSAQCHNSSTDGQRYYLHGSVIAQRRTCGVEFHWCGWYTHTTANHMNKILAEMGSNLRVSYAQARDTAATAFYVEEI